MAYNDGVAEDMDLMVRAAGRHRDNLAEQFGTGEARLLEVFPTE